MAYKTNTENYQDIMVEKVKEGKKVTCLYNNGYNDTFYEVKEYIGLVTNIIERGDNSNISKFEVLFDENKTAVTMAYIDDSIVEGTLVSLIGYFTDWGGLSFNSKGGINKVRLTLKDLYITHKLNVMKIYRTGIILNLSKVEIAKIYNRNKNICSIKGLSNFYYIVEDFAIKDTFKEKIDKIVYGYVRNDNNIICEKPTDGDFNDIPDVVDTNINTIVEKDMKNIEQNDETNQKLILDNSIKMDVNNIDISQEEIVHQNLTLDNIIKNGVDSIV